MARRDVAAQLRSIARVVGEGPSNRELAYVNSTASLDSVPALS